MHISPENTNIIAKALEVAKKAKRAKALAEKLRSFSTVYYGGANSTELPDAMEITDLLFISGYMKKYHSTEIIIKAALNGGRFSEDPEDIAYLSGIGGASYALESTLKELGVGE